VTLKRADNAKDRRKRPKAIDGSFATPLLKFADSATIRISKRGCYGKTFCIAIDRRLDGIMQFL
jgi:hypothetical protein